MALYSCGNHLKQHWYLSIAAHLDFVSVQTFMTIEFVTLVDEKDDINRVQAGGSLTVVVLILVALTLYNVSEFVFHFLV